jgi:hypothetical protein
MRRLHAVTISRARPATGRPLRPLRRLRRCGADGVVGDSPFLSLLMLASPLFNGERSAQD